MDPVQNNAETTGGITGNGFVSGVSGNPGGRPKGIAKTVHAVLGRAAGPGEDPSTILVGFWTGVMADEAAKMRDRLEASKLIADRGWGKASPTPPLVGDEDEIQVGITTADVAAEMDRDLDEIARKRRQHERQGTAAARRRRKK